MNPNINTLNNNSSENNLPQFHFKEKIISYIKNIPLFVRFVIITSIILYIFNFISPSVGKFLSNYPYETFIHFQIWRFFTSVFVSTSLLNFLFALLFWFRDAVEFENSNGTLKYFFLFMIHASGIQIIYSVLYFILILLFKTFDSALSSDENNGLWPLVMAELTISCLANPEAPLKIFFTSCQIKAKYYPFIVFLLFILFNQFQIQFNIFAGIIYGLIYHYSIRKILVLKISFIQKSENCPPFKYLRYFKCYKLSSSGISISIINNNSGSNTIQSQYANNNSNKQQPAPSINKGFQAFRGKGVKVGETVIETKGDYQGINNSDSLV